MKTIRKYIFMALLRRRRLAYRVQRLAQRRESGQHTLRRLLYRRHGVHPNVNACYVPMAWEFNNTYFPEWYLATCLPTTRSKAAENLADGGDLYDLENFKINPNNAILLDYYRAKFQGVQRCNLALQQVPTVEPDATLSAERQECLMGEAYFLRAFYYFQLVRVFGGVPLIDHVIDSSTQWRQPRATAEAVYEHIIQDLIDAEKRLWNKSQYSDEDLGRVTKGAAQAMLCKVYLYMHAYDEAYTWGKKWVDDQYRAGEYSLCADFGDNFTPLPVRTGPRVSSKYSIWKTRPATTAKASASPEAP